MRIVGFLVFSFGFLDSGVLEERSFSVKKCLRG